MIKPPSHEVWVKLPDGTESVAGESWTLEQAQHTQAQMVLCAKKAGWRYVYTIREVPMMKIRDLDYPTMLGYILGRETPTPNTSVEGDYGADPLGDGTFRMVPSGDVVDYAEYKRRLGGNHG